MIARAGSALLALPCLAAALWFAGHHPLAPAVAAVVAVALAGVAFVWPLGWPLALWVPLPLIGLMPWTGWLVVEELDIAVLAVAAGAHARLALGWGRKAPTVRRLAPVLLWMVPLVLSTLVSAVRGVVAAQGGVDSGLLGPLGHTIGGWWQGFHEPLNAWRLAKPVFWGLLLLGPWRAACRVDAAGAHRVFAWALCGLLGTTALPVLWERLAFPGLLDFTSDYRATGLWWEMHVGGAALDAMLALAFPLAVAVLLVQRRAWAWVLAAAVLALGTYAALATFSRIVYAAVPVSLALMEWLHWRQQPAGSGKGTPGWAAVAWISGFGLLAWWMFGTSGYRGLAALWGAAVLGLMLAPRWQGLPGRGWLAGLSAGGLGIGVTAGLAILVPKGAYIALSGAAVATLLAAARNTPPQAARWPGLAAYVATLGSLVAVALHWGGAKAAPAASVAALTLLAVATWAATRPAAAAAWPASMRWQAQVAGVMLAGAGLVSVFGAGAYMGQRMAASAADGGSRFGHWSGALALLDADDWLFGKGLGRYHANQAFSGEARDHTGDARLVAGEQGRPQLVLTSGRHDLGWSEAYRLSQRIAAPSAVPVVLHVTLRTRSTIKLQYEVCEKHLLYPGACLGAEDGIEPKAGQWQTLALPLRGKDPLPGGPAWAPRLVAFSVSLGQQLNRAEIQSLSLRDAHGRELLQNGDFGAGFAHWFTTSDRWHMPWHAKNMVLHVLFETGVLGLVAWTLLLGAALWRCTLGAARGHRLAPALSAALMGLLMVGLVDSVLDMPRVAFAVLSVVLVALNLPQRKGVSAAA